jgi:hypothetical protein
MQIDYWLQGQQLHWQGTPCAVVSCAGQASRYVLQQQLKITEWECGGLRHTVVLRRTSCWVCCPIRVDGAGADSDEDHHHAAFPFECLSCHAVV